MKTLYTSMGDYAIHKVILNEEMQESLERDDMEPVINYCIDTDQIVCLRADEPAAWEGIEDEFEDAENGVSDIWAYTDNTGSGIKEKRHCYYVRLENAYVEEN